MTITEEFKNAVKSKNIRMVRIMLKDSLIIDPTFKEFNEMNSWAKNNLKDLYDKHDGEVLKSNLDEWTEDYMNSQMIQVVYNFSEERITLLKKISEKLYSEKINQIKNKRENIKSQNQISKKDIGKVMIVGGVLGTITGIVVAKTTIVATGVAVGVVGYALTRSK